MELNREQIIKALECCPNRSCGVDCPYYEAEICTLEVMRDALSLIKELTEENERLRELATTKEVEKEIVRKETKAETVRKMQELIYERLDISVEGYSSEEIKSDVRDMVDQIAKEMLEGV